MASLFSHYNKAHSLYLVARLKLTRIERIIHHDLFVNSNCIMILVFWQTAHHNFTVHMRSYLQTNCQEIFPNYCFANFFIYLATTNLMSNHVNCYVLPMQHFHDGFIANTIGCTPKFTEALHLPAILRRMLLAF
mgnify:CR=1 FL=1